MDFGENVAMFNSLDPPLIEFADPGVSLSSSVPTKGVPVSKSHKSLEKAIVDKAMREPEFLAKLLQDPRGFLQSLARESVRPRTGFRLWAFEAPRVFFRLTSRMLKHSN